MREPLTKEQIATMLDHAHDAMVTCGRCEDPSNRSLPCECSAIADAQSFLPGDVEALAAELERHTKAVEAVNYILRRIQNDANTHYYLGAGTQALYLLCQAEAALTGLSLAEVEKKRSECFFSDKAEITQMHERYRNCECAS